MSVNEISEEIDPIHDLYKKKRREVEFQLERWEQVREKAFPFVKEMILLGCDYNVSDNDLNFSISGDKEKFLQLVRCHRRHGFKPVMPGKGATSARWWVQVDDLRIFVSFSSTVCRQVQVGTRLQEVPVYETVCDSFAPTEVEYNEAMGTISSPAPQLEEY